MFRESALGNQEFLKTPEVIETPHPFVTVGDIDAVVKRLIPELNSDTTIDVLQKKLLQIQKKYAPPECTFYSISHGALTAEIESTVRRHLAFESHTGILNFDRYLLPLVSQPNHLRLELSRGADNTLVPRPGSSLSREDQIAALFDWLQAGQYEQILLVDDVIAFASTFLPVIELIREQLPSTTIQAITGICSTQGTWAGKEKLAAAGVDVDAVVTVVASPAPEGSVRGMAIPDSRDSTILGGKIGKLKDGRAASFPYFYPFSIPTDSLVRNGLKLPASREWVSYNLELISYLDTVMGRAITIGDLETHGFGVPHTSIDEFKDNLVIPHAGDSVFEFMQYVQGIMPDMVGMLSEEHQ